MISIAMMGHFVCQKPSKQAMAALYVFLEYLMEKDPATGAQTPVLAKNYSLYGHCQINIQTAKHNKTFPDSPGAGVMQEIRYWKTHWVSSLGWYSSLAFNVSFAADARHS